MVEGIDQTLIALSRLDDSIANDYLRQGVKVGAEIMAVAVQREAPVYNGSDSRAVVGAIREAVRVKAARYKPSGVIASLVSIGSGFFKGPTFYAGFVEFGHKIGSRKLGANRTTVPANEFMKRAVDGSQGTAVTAAQETIAGLIDRGV